MPTPSLGRWHVPAEWERHSRCWMAWPSRGDRWPDGLETATAAHAELARTIAAFEPVTMICNPEDAVDASLACGAGIQVLPLAVGDGWLRDTGPSFLVNDSGGVAGVHWRFDGWGGRIAAPGADATIGRRILEHLALPTYEAPLVLEGGAYSVDGAGAVLVTEQCLLDGRRNPGLSRAEIEEQLTACTGAGTVIWLGGGCEDDDSGGRIDTVAAFVAPGLVLALTTDDPQDGNFRVLQDNLDRLKKARDARGRSLEVVMVRQPARRPRATGAKRLTLSYTSCYLANGAVILPGFGDAADQEARRTLRKLFPRREVVQLPALEMAAAGAGLHGLTLHQPAALPLPYDPVI
ncbi:MAG: agmatine deiminase family protein [Rhodospirillaceae bacterium]